MLDLATSMNPASLMRKKDSARICLRDHISDIETILSGSLLTLQTGSFIPVATRNQGHEREVR